MRNGAIPLILGSTITLMGITFKRKYKKLTESQVIPVLTSGIIGFGLAHVLLGTIELIQPNE